MSDARAPFSRVIDELTNGCGCACHFGTGYRTSCEHCASASDEGSLDRLDRVIEKAWRWKDAGWYSEAEWPAVAATLFVNDHESLTPEERERAIEAGKRIAAKLRSTPPASEPETGK